MMKKISSSIFIASFSLTMITSLIIGGFIFINSSKYIKTETKNKLSYMSGSYSQSFSRRLHSVETIISTAHTFIINSFDITRLENNESYIAEYEAELDGFFRDTALGNNDFEGIYLTFNSELSGEFREIWYLAIEKGDIPRRVDNELYNKYSETPSTGDNAYPSISLFTPENPAMFYYYEAIRTGQGAWSEPGPEEGLPIEIISYTEPVYKDDILIGVIGIDINIESLRQSIREIEVLDKGYAFLLNSDLEIIIHPEYPEYTSIADVESETFSLLKTYPANTDSNKTEIFTGDEQIFSCSRLSNGWILVLTAANAEIFKPLTDLAFTIVIIALLISGFSFIAAWFLSSRISTPVELAAEQLKHVEIGDLNLQIPESLMNRTDEIGSVVKSVDIITELIRVEVEKNRRQDAILTHQSRLAKTGEMIAHIAHQWRQPINSLNLILSNMEEDYHSLIDAEPEARRAVDKSRQLIKQMSQTIEDFRYFLHPQKKQDYFSIKTSILFVIDMIQDSLKAHQISINTGFDELPQIYGPANEFTQVILNILYNARDALRDTATKNNSIMISVKMDNRTAVIEIRNNGPWIPEEIMKELFKPYFTTKGEEKGTGIGLYMSRIIIEKHFNGEIIISNTDDGVCVIIRIPYNE